MQVRGAECVVMAGDPKQLPPTLHSDGALDAQLDRTLFDRLQDSGVCAVASLTVPHAMQAVRVAVVRPAGTLCPLFDVIGTLGYYTCVRAECMSGSGLIGRIRASSVVLGHSGGVCSSHFLLMQPRP